MEPIQYLRALRRRWPVIAAAVLVAAVAAFVTTPAVSDTRPVDPSSSYAATTVLWDEAGATGEGSSPITFGSALTRVLLLPDVVALAADELGGKADPAALGTQVQSFVDTESGFFEIIGFGTSPKAAEKVSSAFRTALLGYLTQLRNEGLEAKEALLRQSLNELVRRGASDNLVFPVRDALAQLVIDRFESVGLTVIQEPVGVGVQVPGIRAPRSRWARAGLAAALGLLLGLTLALVLERFDTKIRTRRRAEERFDLPVLAEIPVMRRRERTGVALSTHPVGRAADAFRLLGSSVAGAWVAHHGPETSGNGNGHPNGRGGMPKTILVTSAGPGDGKTTVAANLAAVFGELGKRVTVLSCDLRRPAIHRLFGVPVGPGLTEVLDGSEQRLRAVYTDVTNVWMVPSGRATASPGKALASERMKQILSDVADRAAVVILDCSPVLVASDIAPLLPHVDAVLLVARAGKTSAELAERTTDVLRQLAAPVVGVALNGSKEISMPTSYRHYYDASKVVELPKSETVGFADA